MQTKINNTIYTIGEFDKGFAWATSKTESDSFFYTELEALQDAIDHETAIAEQAEDDLARRLEDEIFGSYETQVIKTYNLQIRG